MAEAATMSTRWKWDKEEVKALMLKKIEERNAQEESNKHLVHLKELKKKAVGEETSWKQRQRFFSKYKKQC